MIRYDLIKNTFIVMDKHKNIIFDSDNPTISIKALKYKKTFSKQEKIIIGKYLKSRLVEAEEYDPSMFHEFLDNYLVTNKIRSEPGVGTNLKNGLVKAKPYADAINSTYVIIGGILSTAIGMYLKYRSMEEYLSPGKKVLLEEEEDDELEEKRNQINKEIRRRRSVTKGRGRSRSTYRR